MIAVIAPSLLGRHNKKHAHARAGCGGHGTVICWQCHGTAVNDKDCKCAVFWLLFCLEGALIT
jgi:hypothetical protein